MDDATHTPEQARTVQDVIARQHIPTLAALSGKDSGTVYRIAQGGDFHVSTLKAFFNVMGDRDRLDILQSLCFGHRIVSYVMPDGLDFNGDGEVSSDDAIDEALKALDDVSRLIKSARNRDDAPSAKQRLAVKDATRDAIAHLANVDGVMDHLAATRRKGRPKSPLFAGGGGA
ncbi:MAG: hypothetical protein AAFY08_14450 [Planctomycetota bacterium]